MTVDIYTTKPCPRFISPPNFFVVGVQSGREIGLSVLAVTREIMKC